jgi:hypothetical protein
MEGANNFVAEELPQMHIPSFLPSQNEPPPRGALLLLLRVMIRFFFSITYPLHFFPSFKKAFQERERKLTAVVPHFFSSTSQEGSSSLLLPSPQQPLLPPELTHSLPHSKGN